MMRRIIFGNEEWLLIGTKKGAITKEEHYRNGIMSFAHLCEDGLIRRHKRVIGKKEDIEFLEEIPDVIPAEGAMGNLLDGFLENLIGENL